MNNPNASPLKAVTENMIPLLPCAHQPGNSVLVCLAGHTNLLGMVRAVSFTDGGSTFYDVSITDTNNESPIFLTAVPSWRVAAVPESYLGAPTACTQQS